MNPLESLGSERMDRTLRANGMAAAISEGRRRRRRRGFIAGTLAVAICIGTGIAVTGGHTGRFSVTPAAIPPKAVVTVDGIGVTWLPAGYAPNNSTQRGNVPTLGPINWYQEFHNPKFAAAPNGYTVVGLALVVHRGPAPDLAATAQDPISQAGNFESSWTTVRGHRALLRSRPQSALLGPAAFELLWEEQKGLSLQVDAFGGPTLQQAEQLAKSLVIHDSTTSTTSTAKTAADVAQIRAAFKQAYTSPNPPAVALGAVEGGSALAATLAKVTQVTPDSVGTSRVTTGDISFLSQTEALVNADVTYHWMGTGASNALPQTATLIDGKWKVSRASFCDVIGGSGIHCPPSSGN